MVEHDDRHFVERLDAIRALPPCPEKLDLLTPAFRLYTEGELAIYYAPFHYVNPTARVAVVGITPGLHQMQLALSAARQALLDGVLPDEAIIKAKRTASFGGPMRKNLTSMLDGLGLASALGVPSTDALWADRPEQLHATSAIRYPVFRRDENYTGHSPPILGSALLRDFVENVLARELEQTADALIVPCGDAVGSALAHLADCGRLNRDRCLIGFPHPSGGNGWRVRHYRQRREAMAAKIATWFT